VESKPNRKPIEIPLPFSLLLIPLLFIGAGVSIPISYVQRRIQRRRERRFQNILGARDRVLEWPRFLRAVEQGTGTVIEERYLPKGPIRWWWTPEKIRDLSPYEITDEITMLRKDSDHSFAIWCRDRYTSVEKGHALLVATKAVPREELRAIRSRAAAEPECDWIKVVPLEMLLPKP
jgi:hypothetical protein